MFSVRHLPFLTAVLCLSCHGPSRVSELKGIYSWASHQGVDARRPVIVIPGILGSKLDDENGRKVWGSFTFGAVDPDKAEGARTISLPMAFGKPLSELRDKNLATAVLDVLVADVGVFSGLKSAAYLGILSVLDIGGFRDLTLGENGAVHYGEGHYTCFQFPYDWRRDISESAVLFGNFVADAQDYVREARHLSPETPVEIDVVAHSMGGLLLRYYLRYGSQPLPEDGSMPVLTWEGADNIRNAVLVATPNSGSMEALRQLVNGLNLHPLFPNYRPSVLGTMPAIYQMLVRTRHGGVKTDDGEVVDILSPSIWKKYGWGLANPEPDQALHWLIPDVSDEARRATALDHLEKCLSRAQQFQRALDVPAEHPRELRLSLFAGDGRATESEAVVHANGHLKFIRKALGDGTVTRASALIDEREGGPVQSIFTSPVTWDRVQFVDEDHLGLTYSPEFIDNLLFMLLERP